MGDKTLKIKLIPILLSYVSKGIFFIATGEKYRKEAIKSAKRVKDVCNYPISVATDDEITCDIFDEVIDINGASELSAKPSYIRKSPYKQTIYLDTDTWICDKKVVDELFDIINQSPIAATFDTHHSIRADLSVRSDAPFTVPMLNTGVLVLDMQRSESFLNSWHSRDQQLRERFPNINDQFAFREVISSSNISYRILPQKFNVRLPYKSILSGRARILHGHIQDYRSAENEINGTDERRVIHPITPTKDKFINQPFYFSVGCPSLFDYFSAWARFLIAWGPLAIIIATVFSHITNSNKAAILAASVGNEGVKVTTKKILNWYKYGDFSTNT